MRFGSVPPVSRRNNKPRYTVIYVGVGIFPVRIAGDKNFILQLSQRLADRNVMCRFVSVADTPTVGSDHLHPSFTYLSRPFHFIRRKWHWYDNNGKLIGYHHKHRAFWDIIELGLTLVLSRRKLRELVKDSPIPLVVHWSDYGLVLPILRWIVGRNTPLIASALRYDVNRPFLGRLRALGFSRANAVIVGTRYAREKLVEGGCNNNLVEPLSWGSASLQNGDQERSTFSKKVRLVWLGFMQQIREEDFLATAQMASEIVSRREELEFTFLFKPESFQERYRRFERPGIHLSTTSGDFEKRLPTFDGLLSPTLRQDSSFAPPLSWIESLSAGVPIITTRSKGIDELLTHGRSAMIFDSWEEMSAWLAKEDIAGTLSSMRTLAKKEFEERYHISKVAERYDIFYEKVISIALPR